MPDPLVVAHAEHDVVDVSPHLLADGGHGVDERELGGQEGVAGVLDGLGRRRVGDHERGRDPDVEGRDPDGGALVVGPDDHPVGVQEVLHRRAFAEELRIGHHVDVGTLQGPLDHPGRADGHGRLVDDDRLGGQHGADLVGGSLDVAEVGSAVGPLGCGHGQVDELGLGGGGRGADHEAQAAAVQALPDDGVEALLDDGDLTPDQGLDPGDVDVGADDLVAQMGEARGGRQPDVTSPYDSDIGHGATRRPGRPGCWAPRRRHRSSWSPSRPRGRPASSRARFRRPRPPARSGAAAGSRRPRRSPCR